ncbi:MAG: VCBS domain-containing protein [Synergistaceae bacterium]|nr:VCBS domain-containing protein [Synergistaceae bacterium]MBR0094313.1 VCBS domain-containing protein [Synergistaceae bacterium]
MKRLLVALTLVALFAVAAFAGVQDFGRFTIDVPEGWTATKDGETVGIVKDDNTASASITVDSTDGSSLKEIAEAFVEALGGKNLAADGDTFTFEFTNANGVESKAVVSGDDKDYCLIVMTGIENAPDDFSAMLESLTEK